MTITNITNKNIATGLNVTVTEDVNEDIVNIVWRIKNDCEIEYSAFTLEDGGVIDDYEEGSELFNKDILVHKGLLLSILSDITGKSEDELNEIVEEIQVDVNEEKAYIIFKDNSMFIDLFINSSYEVEYNINSCNESKQIVERDSDYNMNEEAESFFLCYL